MAENKKQKKEGAEAAANGSKPQSPWDVDPDLAKTFIEMEDVQTQLDKVNDEASDKVLEVEQTYNKLRRPHYKRRNEIARKIPRFWMTALQHHPALARLINEEDSEVLEHCTEVDVEDFEDIKSGFKISFTFSNNPFFTNTQIVKTYRYTEDASLRVECDNIQWKAGQEPREPDDDDDAEPGQKRTARGGKDYSFFLWFASNHMAPGEQDPVANILKEEIWSNPIKYYLNEDEEEEEFEMMGEDDEDEGEDFEGEEDPEDD